MLIVNYINHGGILQYFETLKSANSSNKQVIFLHNPSYKKIKEYTMNGVQVVFTHLTKEVILYLIMGNNCHLIWHDPKLRLGHKWREWLLYKSLIFFRKKVKSIFVHSSPDSEIKSKFLIHQFKMPFHDVSNYDSKIIKILFFGRIERYKGIHIYCKLFENYDAIKLTIAGVVADDLKSHFTGLKKVQVFDNYITDDTVSELIYFSDYIIMPYLDVTNTNVHLMAFKYGKPVIRSDIAGFNEWKHVNPKLIFNSLNIEEVLKSLPSRDSSEYNEFSRSAIKYFEENNGLQTDFVEYLLNNVKS